jgi:hypothetical protein
MKRILLLFACLVILIACQPAEPVDLPEISSATPAPPKISATPNQTPRPTATRTAVEPFKPAGTQTPIATLPPTPLPPGFATLEILRDLSIPVADPYDLALRLRGLGDLPALPALAAPLEIGAIQKFWRHPDGGNPAEIIATLQGIGNHAYLWIDNALFFDPVEADKLVYLFDYLIYPNVGQVFGEEPNPGLDGDPRLHLLLAHGAGIYTAGYFSAADQLHPALEPYSNGRDLIVLNGDNLDLADLFTASTLAREFQKMIHWNLDPNEELWLKEGFSDLASLINELPAWRYGQDFADNPDLQLNRWSNDEREQVRHAGAAALFAAYLYGQLGEQGIRAVSANPENGWRGLELALAELGVTNPVTGQMLTAEELFFDWALANYINDPELGCGQYAYAAPGPPVQFKPVEVLRACDGEARQYQVNQFGFDAIRLACPGQYLLRFSGNEQVALLPVEPHSGAAAFWSNRADASDLTLTRSFDFRGVDAEDEALTLNYWIWFDIEKDYDYLLLEASLDGQRWQMLTPPGAGSLTPERVPAFMPANAKAYTGRSRDGGWQWESIDLSAFAGQKVQIRFEYVTDAAYSGGGVLIDDIVIPAIGYAADFEQDDGGWEAQGWARVTNLLPQRFRLALIREVHGLPVGVEYVSLDAQNSTELSLEIDEGAALLLVVAGVTPFSQQPASYTLELIGR